MPGDKKRIAVVQAVFHEKELAVMLAAAKDEAKKLGLEIAEVRSVPGSLEIPFVMKRMLARADIDGGVVLGIIERGETAHGRVMGEAVTQELLKMELIFDKPIGFGIIGPEIEPHQFAPRLEPFGRRAVAAAANLLTQL